MVDQVQDFFGIPGPLRFGGLEHHLRWLAVDEVRWLPGYGGAPIQRYLPADEPSDRPEHQLTIQLIRRPPVEVWLAIQQASRDRAASGDPVAGHRSDRHPDRPDDDLLVDHLMAGDDGQVVQWCAERAVTYEPANLPDTRFTVLFSVVRHAFGAEIPAFMEGLKQELPATLSELTTMEIPRILAEDPQPAVEPDPAPRDALGIPGPIRFDDVDHHLDSATSQPVTWLPDHPDTPEQLYVPAPADRGPWEAGLAVSLLAVTPGVAAAAWERPLAERAQREPITQWQVWYQPSRPDEVIVDSLVSNGARTALEWTAERLVPLPPSAGGTGWRTASYRLQRRGHGEQMRAFLEALGDERGRLLPRLWTFEPPPVRL